MTERLDKFLRGLDGKDATERKDAVITEILETGGTYNAGPEGRVGSDYAFLIHLHEISAYGTNDGEAIDSWIKIATYMNGGGVMPKGMGSMIPFPSPRNHAEEIANARAAVGVK